MSVFNIAEHILTETGPLAPEKLERLVYFAQEDVLAEGLGPLFHEPIEAWDHGPVCPALFHRLNGRLIVHPGDLGGVRESLAPAKAGVVSAMLLRLKQCSTRELNALACGEAPWQQAHADQRSGPGNLKITAAAIARAHGRSFPPLR
ncbi:Panacea domain-containing protein [Tropicimonas marinistellae]|uniref:Panacea domain-containing protein n=1 Tax=Tropicimonas marinistellae TaxID=1739787 RepID=UPI00082F6A8E|nr:type II toxin-antitoxin system antitoxin SocA domain-containing protein [Tropicimonas marinistellae]